MRQAEAIVSMAVERTSAQNVLETFFSPIATENRLDDGGERHVVVLERREKL